MHPEKSGFDRHAKCQVLRESQTDLDIFLEKRVSRVHLSWPLRMAIPKNEFWSFFLACIRIIALAFTISGSVLRFGLLPLDHCTLMCIVGFSEKTSIG